MTQRPLILTFAILLALVSACAGGDDPAETESNAPVEAAPDAAASEAPGATDAPEATETPEPAQPTTAPELTAEESTAAPSPTLAPAPTDEPTVVATVASMDDDASQGGDEAAVTGDGWGASGSGAQSACDHPYFSMRVGSSWTYSDGENTLLWEITDIQGDMDHATADLRATIGDIVIDYVWDCTAGSAIASFDFASLGVAPAGTEMTIENQTMEGVFLLPADQLQPGATWDLTLVDAFLFTQEAGGTEIEVTGDLTSEQQLTVMSTDPVTFEDQTVEGVQTSQESIIAPVILLVDVASALSQGVGNTELAHRVVANIKRAGIVELTPIS